MAAAGWKVINESADEHDRAIDQEHFGVLVPYTHGDEVPAQIAEVVRRRLPDVDPSEVVPVGHKGLRDQIERFIDVGASKFVPVLAGEPPDWHTELEELAAEVLDLQN